MSVTPLIFESPLRASRDELWAWMTDVDCLRREMMPNTITFVPRLPRAVATWFVGALFRHRHAVLRRVHGLD